MNTVKRRRWLSVLGTWASYLGIATLAGLFLWGIYDEFQLFFHHGYSIARITGMKRGNKFERQVTTLYVVAGEVHDGTASWDKEFKVGERYVVKYAIRSPYRMKLLYDHPVPDSISAAEGVQWQRFLAKSQLW